MRGQASTTASIATGSCSTPTNPRCPERTSATSWATRDSQADPLAGRSLGDGSREALGRRRGTTPNTNPPTLPAVCGSATAGTYNFGGNSPVPVTDAVTTVGDYIPAPPLNPSNSTLRAPTNTTCRRPPSEETDQANHQYDVNAVSIRRLKDGQLPAVSFLKAPSWADGHPGYSDPLDEAEPLW